MLGFTVVSCWQLLVVSSTRFGEDDANLQMEEKMWARIQRERRKRSRSSNVFNLGDDSGASDLITHKGQALDDVHLSYDGDRASDEELGAEVVDQLHFGGGAGDASQTHEVRAPCAFWEAW